MIRCKIYSCKKLPYQPCCLGCTVWDCLNRCENHPDRCKCSVEGDLPKPPKRPEIPPPDRRRKLDYDEIARLYYDERLLKKDIAERLGCSYNAIKDAIRKIGGDGDG